MQPDQLRLRRRYEPYVVILVAVEILVEVRKVRAPEQGLSPRDRRRVDLGETRLDLEIDHPRDERALQRRTGAPKHVEPRAGELRAARDVEDAERLADLPVRARLDRELLRRVLADHRVVVLVLALRHARIDHVRDPQELLVALGLKRVQVPGDRLDALPQLPHARLYLVARRTATAGPVALGIEVLQLTS